MMKKEFAVYKELMGEISDEVREGLLAETDTIQVLRADSPVVQDYRPVKDWYHDAFAMKEELETPLEEMYLEEEFTPAEWKQMHEELEQYKQQYESEKDRLEEVKVKDILTEMKQMQKLFG